jgi:hypothetical protein
MMCLRHGKSVLCEKPMALNAQQARKNDQPCSKIFFLMQGVWTRLFLLLKSTRPTGQKADRCYFLCESRFWI